MTRLRYFGVVFAVLFCLAVDANGVNDSAHSSAYERGVSYAKKGDRSLAEAAFLEASKDLQAAPDAYFQLAWLSIGSSEWQKAENWIRQFLKARPVSEQGLYLLGYVLFRQGDYERAEKTLRDLLQENPENVEGHKILGLVYFQLQRKDEAQTQLRSVVRLNPRLAEGHYLLG